MFPNKYHYILLNYIGISTSISLASSICILFIYLLAIGKWSTIFKNYFLLALFVESGVSVFGTVIVFLRCIYVSL